MTFVEFEHRVLPRVILPLMAVLGLLALAAREPVRAAEKNTFVISDNEGYGITECLTNGSSCGRIVADAWCEAHGLGPALAFGRADDVTGSIPAAASDPTKPQPASTQPAATQVRPNALLVTCDN